ncbi:tail fiber assembly protein [Vibrio cholerae]
MFILDKLTHDGVTYYGVREDGFYADGQQMVGVHIDVITAAVVDKKWGIVRGERDSLISQCDWTQMPDAPLDEAKKAEFTAYRQALRDIPQTYSDPDSVVWPEKPTL